LTAGRDDYSGGTSSRGFRFLKSLSKLLTLATIITASAESAEISAIVVHTEAMQATLQACSGAGTKIASALKPQP
jgi:hypothetical protein